MHQKINLLGYENTKNVTIDGDLGDQTACAMRAGTFIVNGSVEEYTGLGFRGGLLHIRGSAFGSFAFDAHGGNIILDGNYEGDDLIASTDLLEETSKLIIHISSDNPY